MDCLQLQTQLVTPHCLTSPFSPHLFGRSTSASRLSSKSVPGLFGCGLDCYIGVTKLLVFDCNIWNSVMSFPATLSACQPCWSLHLAFYGWLSAASISQCCSWILLGWACPVWPGSSAASPYKMTIDSGTLGRWILVSTLVDLLEFQNSAEVALQN